MISLSNVSKEKDIFTILGKNMVEEKNSDSGFFNIFSTISQKKFFNDERVENITSDISDDNIDFGFLASDISSVFNNEISKDMNFSTNFTNVGDGIESLDSILAKINANATKIGQSEADDLVNSITGKLFNNSSKNNNKIDNYLGKITDIEQINSFKTDNSINLVNNNIDGSEFFNDINSNNLKNSEIKNADIPKPISFITSDIENIINDITDDILADNKQSISNKIVLNNEPEIEKSLQIIKENRLFSKHNVTNNDKNIGLESTLNVNATESESNQIIHTKESKSFGESVKKDAKSVIHTLINNDNLELIVNKPDKVLVRYSDGKTIDIKEVIKKIINDKIDIEPIIATKNNSEIDNVNFDKKVSIIGNNEIKKADNPKAISLTESDIENIVYTIADDIFAENEQAIGSKIVLNNEPEIEKSLQIIKENRLFSKHNVTNNDKNIGLESTLNINATESKNNLIIQTDESKSFGENIKKDAKSVSELKSEIKNVLNSLISKIDNPELTIDKSDKVIVRASNGKTIDIKDVIKKIINDKIYIEPIITTNNNNKIDKVNFEKTDKVSKNNEINTNDIKKSISTSISNFDNVINNIADDLLAKNEQVIVNKIGNSEEKNIIENSTKKLDIHLAKNKEVSHKEIKINWENGIYKTYNEQNNTSSIIDGNTVTTSSNDNIKSNIINPKDLEVSNIDQKEIHLEQSSKFISTLSDETSNQFDEKVERASDILNVKIDDNQSKETKDLSERIGTNSKSETNGANNNSQSNNNSQNKQNQPNQPQDNLTNINQIQNTFTKATEPTLIEPNMPRPFAYTSKLGELSSKISTIVSKNTEFGTSTARINLSPKSLGTLVVEITQKKEDLKIVINAESKDIANLIEQNIGGLKEKLISQGMNSQNIELNINVQTQTATLMNKGENRDDGKNARQDRKQNRYAKSSDMLSDIEQSTMNYTKYDSGKFIEKYIWGEIKWLTK